MYSVDYGGCDLTDLNFCLSRLGEYFVVSSWEVLVINKLFSPGQFQKTLFLPTLFFCLVFFRHDAWTAFSQKYGFVRWLDWLPGNSILWENVRLLLSLNNTLQKRNSPKKNDDCSRHNNKLCGGTNKKIKRLQFYTIWHENVTTTHLSTKTFCKQFNI